MDRSSDAKDQESDVKSYAVDLGADLRVSVRHDTRQKGRVGANFLGAEPKPSKET